MTRITLARRAKSGPGDVVPWSRRVGTGLFQGHYEFAPISLFWPFLNCGCRQAYLAACELWIANTAAARICRLGELYAGQPNTGLSHRRDRGARGLRLVTRILLGIMAWAEQLNRRLSKVGNPCVYDNAQFSWVREIERQWRLIRAELDRLLLRKDELPAFHYIVPGSPRSVVTTTGRHSC